MVFKLKIIINDSIINFLANFYKSKHIPMKHFLLILIAFFAITTVQSQDLPANPEPGKCYVRCIEPDVFVNEEVTFMTRPAYKKIVTHPAEYKTETEKVLVKEKSTKFVAHPAEWGTETVSYIKKEDASTLKVIPATFKGEYETIEIKPEAAYWVLGDRMPDCESSDPNDCRVWCYKISPAEFETYPIQLIDIDANTKRTPVPEKESSYIKKVITKPAWTEEIVIPAEHATITKTVLVKDAWQEEVTVPAEYKTVTKEVLQKKGGLTTWKKVDCHLTEYNVLPINWNLGSYTLTPQAKGIIDQKLIPVLNKNEGTKVEVTSHTDSRGTKADNQLLSERRAQAVVNYLVEKGINPSRLVANGYGEEKLLNRCSDGVSCTEREHLQNRRTEFRIIP